MNLGDIIEKENLAAVVARVVFDLDLKPRAAAVIEIEMGRQFAAL